jgi:hypothetical protein
MQVSALLTLMGNLSLGNDNVTEVERAIFLQYLNLAHFELYQITANFNQNLIKKTEIDIGVGKIDHDLGFTPYLVNAVYGDKVKLKHMSLLLEDVPIWRIPGTPEYYCIKKQIIIFAPKSKIPFSLMLYYVPQPVLFEKETPEGEIPYPLAYHPVLVDGALYYLFQEEGGFKNMQKSQGAQERWEIGKTRLLSYLYNSSGERLSTFSNV